MNQNPNTQECLRRLSVGRALSVKAAPHFAQVTMNLRPILREGLGTVATTKDMVLLADPDVVATKWQADQIAGAFSHEVLHHWLRHMDRAEAVKAGDPTFDHHLWNVCADFECNRLVAAMGLKLPNGACFAGAYGQPDNVLAEVAYAALKQKQDEEGGNDKQGDEQGDEQGGSGDGDDQQDGSEQGGTPSKQGQRGDFAHGRCGSCSGGEPVDGEGDVPEDAKASQLERRAVEEATAKTILEASQKNPGSIPVEIVRAAEAVVERSKTPWQQVLAAHLHRAVERRRGLRDYTYARPSRRQSVHGWDAGSPVLPSTFDPVIEVAVVVDTSGSMGQAEMQAALVEVDGLLRASRNAVRVVSCDAEVQQAGKVTRVADAAKLLKGGGGTDFRPAFKHLEKHRPAVTVVVTDGYGPAPTDAPRWTDTIWVLVGKYTTKPYADDTFSRTIQWGEFIEVK